MKCPICQEAMQIRTKDNNFNPITGKRYFRNIYWCNFDDVWMSLELPVEGEEEFLSV
jgi:hypothetical protein